MGWGGVCRVVLGPLISLHAQYPREYVYVLVILALAVFCVELILME